MLLGAILAGGVALRCYAITSRSLWFDEAVTCFTSQLSPPQIVFRAAHDFHPPLYYLIVHYWIGLFGTSLLALRSLSVLCGALAIVGAYLLTVEVLRDERRGLSPPVDASDETRRHQAGGSSREAGLWAAALVAVSVFAIRWSWDARMYALGMPLALFSSWALLRALRSPQRSDHY